MDSLAEIVEGIKVVPVVALPSVDAGVRLAEMLCNSDLKIIEITLRTPSALAAIETISARYPELPVLAGTVLNKEQVQQAYDAGVKGIISPGFSPQVIEKSRELSLPVCPAVISPSEVLSCMEYQLDILKFFPAEVAGGTKMLKALAAVFPNIRFMPTGGINPVNLEEYLQLKNVLCCGGSWLAPEKLMRDGAWDEIEKILSSQY